MELPNRKPNRLKEYDYSKSGAYFITICTKNKEKILWNTVGASFARPLQLSNIGKVIENEVNNISNIYDNVNIDKYVIMPNHIHFIIVLQTDATRHPPTISRIIQQFKGAITKKLGTSIWQKLYHDHIIRNDNDYNKIWEYIDTNPQKWEEDCFYI